MDINTVAPDMQSDDVTDNYITYKDPVIKDRKVYWATKRVFDIVVAVVALAVLAIPMLVLAVVIYIDDPSGSPIFSQIRVGRKGRPFKMYKFRSMVVNAEDLQEELWQYNEADGPVFKIADDPRTTRIGRFIRTTNIDELPQLVNIIKGEMSFVGPRPALPKEVQQYTQFHMQRLCVTPGLTCFWQTSSNKSGMTFDEWIDLDIKYIYERNWFTDIKLIWETIKIVIYMFIKTCRG